MAKLGRSTYTLTDLTETLPVSLALQTNKKNNVQTKNGDQYTPNFENDGEELIITPSLFLGQEKLSLEEYPKYKIPNGRENGFLYYEIGETQYKYTGNTSDKIYVNSSGQLVIKENLTENIMIEAYIENFVYESHNYVVPLVQTTNPISFLLLEDNDNFYAVIECENGREHFDDTNAFPIKMAAYLYKGSKVINQKENNVFDTENYSYSWDRLGDGDTKPDGTDPTLIVTRDKILNRDLYTCTITDLNTNLVYSAQQYIYDFSDQYYCTIIHDKPLLLSEANPLVKLTAKVWLREKELKEFTDENKQPKFNLSYEWFAIDSSGEKTLRTASTDNSLEINTSSTNIPKKESFTVYCKVYHTAYKSEDDTVGVTYPIAGNTISFQYIPVYSVQIEPQNIFVNTTNNNVYQGNSSNEYTFGFKLLDKDGNLIDFDISDENIEKGPNDASSYTDGTSIKFEQKTAGKWHYTGIITLNPNHSNSMWNSNNKEVASRSYEFTYVYFGQQFTDEVNVIKNRSGENGEQGFSGYTIDLSNEFHAFSGGEGRADSDQETSCIVSAYFGNEKQTIKEIKINNDFIIYKQNNINGVEKKYTLPNLKGCLFIKASENALKQIEITIRTNNSIKEPDAFLTGIESIPFYISISQDNKEDLSFLKTFTYTINYNGKSYSLVTDTNTIIYSQTNGGTYSPASFNVSATTRAENGAASTYSKGIIIYSFDSKKWKYLGSSGIISDYQNLDNIYIRLYSSLAKDYISSSNINITEASPYLLDMETIPIVTSMDGYEIGGENLLRWTKELPIERKKWETKFSQIQSIKEGNFNFFEFNIPKISTDENSAKEQWTFIESSKMPFDKNYLEKNFCISFEIRLDSLSSDPTEEGAFKGNFGPYLIFNKNYEDKGRGRYGNIFVLLPDGSSAKNVNFDENPFQIGKWIRVNYSFILSETDFGAYDSSESGPITWDECNYMSVRFYLSHHGKIQIRKPKLEMGNLPTLWSPSPYDINYEDISGMNLISDSVKLKIEQQAAQNNNKLFEDILYPDTFYTFSFYESSWEQKGIPSKIERKFRIEIFNEEDLSSKLTFSFPDSYSASRTIQTFKTPSASSSSKFSFCIYPIVAGDEQTNGILTLTKIKLEKGETATSYTITDEFLNNAIETLSANSISTVYFETVNGPMQTTLNNLQTTINDLNKNYVTIADAEAKITAASSDVIAQINNPEDPDNIYFTQLKGSIIIDASNSSDPYIELTASQGQNNISSLRLTDDRIEFLDHNNPVAEIQGSYLRIKKGIFEEDLKIGKLQVSITDSGVGFLWG